MLKTLVALMLGPWGLKVLNYYLQHDAIINSIVFMYGVLLVLAHYNYSKISERIMAQLPKPAKKKNDKSAVKIDIAKAISEGKNFPLVAGNISLFPKRLSVEAVKDCLLKDKKWKEALQGREVHFVE